jgi:hypothetical protein
MDALGNVFPALGLMPVLLLDQFDDYQNRFMEKFLIRKSWLKPEELTATNGFWAEIKKLLDAGRLHCLIATRTDTAGGLATFRRKIDVFGSTVNGFGRAKTAGLPAVFFEGFGSERATCVTAFPWRGQY